VEVPVLGFQNKSMHFVNAIDKSNAIIEFDLSGKILKANRNFLGLMEYTLDEIRGKHHSVFVDQDYKTSKEYENFWCELKAGKFFVSEYCRFTKSGKEVWISASYNPVFRGDTPYKVVKIATDITADRALRSHMQSQLKAIHRAQAVIEFTLDGIVMDANDNFLKTVGYTLEEIKGKHHRQFVDPAEASQPEYLAFWESLRRGEFQVAEYKRIAKGGRTVWIQASYNPLFDSSGRVSGVIKFATDITAAKDMERQLRLEGDRKLAEAVSGIAQSVASTNEQASSAAAAAIEASTNVQAVAAGSSQLASSVTEINNQVTKALTISNEAVHQADQAGSTVGSLVEDAKKISAVVDLISSIAGQTNLLALNATIEAARAGEAGRGFAVVAGEVKSLAAQTAKATGEISAHIMAVQASSELARNAIDAINSTINQMNEISVSISAAVEEQASVTEDMSRNMQEAAKGVEMISENMEQVAGLTRAADSRIREITAKVEAAA
jgi:methyl-accepting chemotaxis protein